MFCKIDPYDFKYQGSGFLSHTPLKTTLTWPCGLDAPLGEGSFWLLNGRWVLTFQCYFMVISSLHFKSLGPKICLSLGWKDFSHTLRLPSTPSCISSPGLKLKVREYQDFFFPWMFYQLLIWAILPLVSWCLNLVNSLEVPQRWSLMWSLFFKSTWRNRGEVGLPRRPPPMVQAW